MRTSDQIDRELAAKALEKRRQGIPPNRQEAAALRRIEAAREEELRWEYYRTIPHKHWREMSGRQSKVINEQAQLYRLPFDGKTVDLPKMVKALHDLLAKHGRKLLAEDEDVWASGNSPWLEKLREEKAKIARIERLELEKKLLPRDEVHDALARLAGILRNCGEALDKHFGRDAHQLLDDFLDDAQREIVALLGLPAGPDCDEHPPDA